MSETFAPKLSILPEAQRDLWKYLAPAKSLSFALYGGTAVALYLGHRVSVDFDFFSAASLDKTAIAAAFAFMPSAIVIQEDRNSLVVDVPTQFSTVKVSFFGGLTIGRLNRPLMTQDGILAVASPEDLLATKLKAILDRAEAKDYRDIAELLTAGTSLERGLGGFAGMFGKDPGLALRALGYFADGDLDTLAASDKAELRAARDRVKSIPEVSLTSGSLIGD